MTKKSHVLEYGPYRIPFTIERADRQHLKIDVHPDQRVIVTAPREKDVADILERLRQRSCWIVKQRRHFEQYRPLPSPRRYISGETHYYLGRQYRLKIRKSNEEQVKLIGRNFIVWTPEGTNSSRVSALMDTWYKDHAENIFRKGLGNLYCSIKRHEIEMPMLKIRKMTKRWGSCTPSKAILLNAELIKTPMHCIDYVIMHELCHLLIPRHGKDFRRLLSRHMPDWEKRKQRLDHIVL